MVKSQTLRGKSGRQNLACFQPLEASARNSHFGQARKPYDVATNKLLPHEALRATQRYFETPGEALRATQRCFRQAKQMTPYRAGYGEFEQNQIMGQLVGQLMGFEDQINGQ